MSLRHLLLRTLTLAAFVQFLPRVHAEAVQPEDFATGLELVPMEPRAVHALTLREDVLSGLVDRARGDVCVFDAAGRQVPHAITAAPAVPSEAALEREYVAVEGQRTPGEGEPLFLYALTGVFHPDRYGLTLPEGTSLEAALEAGEAKEGPFRELDRALFRHDDETQRTIPSTRAPFFRLRVTAERGGPLERAPRLHLGYLPPLLLFSGKGEPPFTLAFGSVRAGCKQVRESELSSLSGEELPSSDTVSSMRTFTLAGERALRPSSPPPPPQSAGPSYVLWGLVLATFVVLALIVARLLRSR